jgi:hypothetical protein
VTDTDEERELKKPITPVGQKDVPVSPPAKDLRTIEQQVDLKYLEMEKNLQQPPAPPQEQPGQPQQPPQVPTIPIPPPVLPREPIQKPPSFSAPPLMVQEEKKLHLTEEELEDIFKARPSEKPARKEPIAEEKPENPAKVKRHLGFGRRVRKTKVQLEQYVEDVAKATRKQDMRGERVFSEDTGEKLGVITDTVYDVNKNIIGYKIKTDDTDTPFSFPADQFTEDKQGLLFTPKWYQNAIETIEKLEFSEKISPELSSLVQDGMFNEELFDLLMKRDDEFIDDLDDAMDLKEILVSQIKILEERRDDLSDKANRLTTKRLMEDIDRKQFSENVQDLRRKVKLLDLNIQKCNDLLGRLNSTSVGTITKYIAQYEDELPQKQTRQPKDTPRYTERPSRDYYEKPEPTLTELIAELIEEKIVDDVKKQIIRNKIPQRREPDYREDHRRRQHLEEDDEDGVQQRLKEMLKKRRQRFR